MKRQELVVCVPGLAQLSGSEAELTGKENEQRERRGEERLPRCRGAQDLVPGRGSHQHPPLTPFFLCQTCNQPGPGPGNLDRVPNSIFFP